MSLTRRIRRRLQRNRLIAKKQRKAFLETLEPRLLLSADLSYTMTGAVKDLTLTLDKVEGIDTLQLINNEDSDSATQVIASQALAETTGIEIIGSELDDILRLDLDFDDILDTIPIAFQGGNGTNRLIGSDTDNAWKITGPEEGTFNTQMSFTDVTSLSGGSGADVFILLDSGSFSGVLTGGEGDDELRGPDVNNVWEITGVNAGILNGQISFTDMENLIGGTEQDDYVFDDGAEVAGMINGEFGDNTVDYSAYATEVTVDLGTGVATGTGTALFIQEFIGGGTAGDTLIGSSGPNTWTIVEAGEGNINGDVSFSNFENLTGSADNEDAFIFTETGSLSGEIVGGEGGFDSLMIQGGTYAKVTYQTSGPGSGSISLDDTVISYAGLGPIIDQSTAAEREHSGSEFADQIRLKTDSAVGTITIESENSTFESITMDNLPTTSLTITAGSGNDTVYVDTLDPAFSASLIIEGGDDTDTVVIEQDLSLFGHDLEINAESVIVNPGVTISTRKVDENNDATNNSGNITLSGQKITIESGAALLADVEEGSSFNAGDITLTAEDKEPRLGLTPWGYSDKQVSISLDGATVKGKDITLQANAEDENPFSELPKWVQKGVISPFVQSPLVQLQNLFLPLSVEVRGSDAGITIQDAAIAGTGRVDIRSTAVVDSSVQAISTINSLIPSPVLQQPMVEPLGLQIRRFWATQRLHRAPMSTLYQRLKQQRRSALASLAMSIIQINRRMRMRRGLRLPLQTPKLFPER